MANGTSGITGLGTNQVLHRKTQYRSLILSVSYSRDGNARSVGVSMLHGRRSAIASTSQPALRLQSRSNGTAAQRSATMKGWASHGYVCTVGEGLCNHHTHLAT